MHHKNYPKSSLGAWTITFGKTNLEHTKSRAISVPHKNNMSAKHFINDPESLVLDCLEALTLVNPQVILDKASKGMRSNPQ